jgi:hypothetical protein
MHKIFPHQHLKGEIYMVKKFKKVEINNRDGKIEVVVDNEILNLKDVCKIDISMEPGICVMTTQKVEHLTLK